MMSRYNLIAEFAEHEGLGDEFKTTMYGGGRILRDAFEDMFGDADRVTETNFFNEVNVGGHKWVNVPKEIWVDKEKIDNTIKMTFVNNDKKLDSIQAEQYPYLVYRYVRDGYIDVEKMDMSTDTAGALRDSGLLQEGSREPVWEELIAGFNRYYESPEQSSVLIDVYENTDASPTGDRQQEEIIRLYNHEGIDDPERRRKLEEAGILEYFRPTPQ